MTAKEQMKKLIDAGERNRDVLVKKTTELAQVSRSMSGRVYADLLRISYMKEELGVQKAGPVRKLKIDALIDNERLDRAKLVREALSKFAPDDCAYDETFSRDLRIARERWSDVRDMEEFKKFQVLLPTRKRVWCLPEKRQDLLEIDGVVEV